MRIAYIHDDKKINTGAHHINDLIVNKLRDFNVYVKSVYPRARLIDNISISLKGVANILFFYSLLEQKKQILKYDLIQGTTYTPLTFLSFNIPVISHFGSTTTGFLTSVPKTRELEKGLQNIWLRLKKDKIVAELDLKTHKPLQDISEIELFVASKSKRVIATSKIVKGDLVCSGHVPANRVRVIHNAIEDYWFDKPLEQNLKNPKLFFLGRLGTDIFTWKLKGLDRLIHIFQKFPDTEKVTVAITINKKLGPWLNSHITNHKYLLNHPKKDIREILHPYRGSIFLLTSRYEGFSLSLVEAMSQGLIPVAFKVGVAPEIIVNGKNGFLVDSVEEAEARVSEVLSNEKMRIKMSQEAYNTSLHFKAETLAKKLVSLYSEVLKKTKSKAIKRIKSPISTTSNKVSLTL